MADDEAYLALVERFKSVLGGPDLMGNATAPGDQAMESVGEKRNRDGYGEGDERNKPSKKGRGSSEWFVVYTQSSDVRKQRYMYNIADGRVAQYVAKGLSDNLFISEVSSSSNLWALILDAATGFTAQEYLISSVFLHKDWIVQYWNKNYFITAVAGANNGNSLLVMSQGAPYTQQSYKISKKFPFSWIKKKWRQGFFVTNLTATGKRWAVVMSMTTFYRDQYVELDCSYSRERLNRLRSRGFQITAAGNTPEHAAVVLSSFVGENEQEFSRPAQQHISISGSFPSDLVKENWTRRIYISSMSYGRTNAFEGKAVKLAITRPVAGDLTVQMQRAIL